MIPFVKSHGLGNDYLVIDEADLGEPLLLPLHSDPRWNVLLKKIGLPMQDA